MALGALVNNLMSAVNPTTVQASGNYASTLTNYLAKPLASGLAKEFVNARDGYSLLAAFVGIGLLLGYRWLHERKQKKNPPYGLDCRNNTWMNFFFSCFRAI